MSHNPLRCPKCGGVTYRLLYLPGQTKCGVTGDRRCPDCHYTFDSAAEERRAEEEADEHQRS